MADGRFLSKNIAFSEQLGQVSLVADYLFMRLIPHLDCEGRLTGSAKSLRARACPLRSDVSDADVASALSELDRAGLIVCYDVDGLQCVEFPNFGKYQVGLRKERESKSKVPATSALNAKHIQGPPQQPVSSPEDSGPTPDLLRTGPTPDESGSPPDNSKLREVKLSKGKVSASATAERSGPEESPPPDQPAVPDPAPRAANWVAVLAEDYTEATEGILSIPQLGKALKPLHDKYGFEELRVRWKVFIAHKDSRFGGEYFVKHFGEYKPGSNLIGVGGDFTPDELRELGMDR